MRTSALGRVTAGAKTKRGAPSGRPTAWARGSTGCRLSRRPVGGCLREPDGVTGAGSCPRTAICSAVVSDTIFDVAAERLEAHSDLDKLEARGTLRIALRTAGLDANALSIAQLEVVMDKIMPGELERRGVWKPESVCSAVMADVKQRAGDAKDAPETGPESVFRRLGSD